MTENAEIWLTQTAYDSLTEELAHLSGPYRKEIAERIALARDEGDLKENGGYHAARDEQGKNEARIRELTEKLRNVRIGTPPDDGIVEPGMFVTATIAGDKEEFLFGSRDILKHDSTDVQVYSPTSLLGQAIANLKPGDTTSYQAPNGNTINVEIISAVPFKG